MESPHYIISSGGRIILARPVTVHTRPKNLMALLPLNTQAPSWKLWILSKGIIKSRHKQKLSPLTSFFLSSRFDTASDNLWSDFATLYPITPAFDPACSSFLALSLTSNPGIQQISKEIQVMIFITIQLQRRKNNIAIVTGCWLHS